MDIAGDDGWTPLMIASCNGHLDCVHLLVDAKADTKLMSNIDMNYIGSTALDYATRRKHPEVVAYLTSVANSSPAKPKAQQNEKRKESQAVTNPPAVPKPVSNPASTTVAVPPPPPTDSTALLMTTIATMATTTVSSPTRTPPSGSRLPP